MAIWDNFPKAFANIVPLSSMGLGATFGMIYNNKSLDDVVKEEAKTREREEVWGEFGEGGSGLLGDNRDYEGMYPDIVDLAMYQLNNPHALLTPWGPTLADEEIDAVLLGNPAMKDLIGLNPEESEGIQKEADGVLSAMGDFIDDLLNEGGEVGMSIGTTALEAAKGLVSTVVPYVASTVDTSLAGQVIQEVKQDAMANGSIMGKYADELYVTSPGGLMQMSSSGTGDEEEEDGEGWFRDIVGAVENAAISAGENSAGGIVTHMFEQEYEKQYSIPDLMDDALIPNAAEDYGATDNEILSDFFSMRIQGEIGDDDLDSFLDRHPEFESERTGLWDGMAGVKDIISLHDSTTASWPGVPYREGAPFSLDLADYTPGVLQEWALLANVTHPPINPLFPLGAVKEEEATAYPSGPTQTGVSVSAVGTGAALDSPLAKEPNLTKVFHEVLATVPGGNHPSVRAMSDELEAEAELLFWLWHGGHAYTALVQAADEGAGDFANVESYFRAFLSSDHQDGGKMGYLWNPDVYRSGGQFLQKVDELKNLTALHGQLGPEMPGFEAAIPLLKLFGADDDDSYARLAGLAALYVTGGHKGYMAQRIQNTMLRNMAYKINKKGMTPTQAFAEATASPLVGQPFSAPPSPQPVYDFSDIAALKASPEYNMRVGDIQGAMPGHSEYDFSDIKAVQDSLEYNLGAEEAKMWSPTLDPTALPATTASSGPSGFEQSFTPAAWAAYLNKEGEAQVSQYAGAPPVDPVTRMVMTKAEHLASMPEPFDDDERVKRAKGVPYRQGLFDNDGNWVAGTRFVPTAGYVAEKQDSTVRITPPEVVAATKKLYGGNQP